MDNGAAQGSTSRPHSQIYVGTATDLGAGQPVQKLRDPWS